MKCLRPLGLFLVTTASLVFSLPTDTTTSRSDASINKLTDVNSTTSEIVTLDVRTPPKIKSKLKPKPVVEEYSHAGIAIPIDEDSIQLEESTKKLNFYKVERPTTNSGLSTWILLSGQTVSTTKPTRKPSIKPALNLETKVTQNLTMVVQTKPERTVKPFFKKRTTTPRTITSSTTPTSTISTTTISSTNSEKPTTMKLITENKNISTTSTTIITTSPKSTTTRISKEPTTMTKIKASILNNAINKKNNETTIQPTVKVNSTTKAIIKKVPKPSKTRTTEISPEAKDGETELSSDTDKKKKQVKRKKNKNRRRKPSEDKSENTSIDKISPEKPIGTQLYNYLSREIMPTVGVGLAGLMVAAGLASYFLYPFGGLRRNYQVDRKDKHGGYYYRDEYSGGIPEEEAIGKVIAGMPQNSLFGNTYKTPTSRETNPGVRYRQVDRRSQIYSQPTYNNVVQSDVGNGGIIVNEDEEIKYDGGGYNDKKYVVGNVPKEVFNKDPTPVTVPEHGPRNLQFDYNLIDNKFVVGSVPKIVVSSSGPSPRNLRIRKKRSGISNDIDNTEDKNATNQEEITTTPKNVIHNTTKSSISNSSSVSTSTTEIPQSNKHHSLFDLVRDLVNMKLKFGMEFLKRVSNIVSDIDNIYHNNNTTNMKT